MTGSGIDYKKLMHTASWGVDRSKLTNDDKDEDVARAFGKALYIEFREGKNTNQMLFIAEAISPKTRAIIPMTMYQRQISSDHERRAWRIRSSRSAKVGTQSDKNTLTFEEQDAPTTINSISGVMEEFRQYFSAMLNGDWKVYKNPIVIEVSADDLLKIEETDTPAALIRRMGRARTESGYDASLFND